ncbi:MAG TPA: glycogen synthase GlgA, partial [Burkholderiales bacterium]|nr:glycogen synthase GlgA [Burkholderiales bacterium]
MRILFVTPECAPLTKTGGLGDVSAALPAALRAQGLDVRTLVPGYREMLSGAPVATLEVLGLECRLLEAGAMLVLDCPALYVRDGGPYQSHEGTDWDDNALRFGVLSKAAAMLGSAQSSFSWRPDVVHCQDWPAGLAAVYLHFEPQRAASIMTIHNLAFQGNFDAGLLARLALPPASFSLEGVEFHGRLSFLKGGIAYADAITTVSPSYAREIQGEALGCGLDGLLRRRREALTGILNGIDVDEWDPATDVRIAQRYDAHSLEAKAVNKAALQRRMGLRPEEDLPLIGTVSRFTHQKGSDLLAAAADEIAAMPAQLAVLGKGERAHEDALRALAARHPGRVAVQVGFDEDLAHAVEAGADLFLMPSRFEPCGLNQMYSQRYGTPPVAHATGGLVDTIVDGVTGFLFEPAEPSALIAAVRRALAAYRDAARWARIQRAGMSRHSSWSAAARRYADLYEQL